MKKAVHNIIVSLKRVYDNKVISGVLRTTLTLLIFYLLFRKINIRLALENLKQINLIILALIMFISLVPIQVLTVMRLKLFLDHNKIRITFFQLLRFHFISLFFQSLLPTSLSSDAVKIYYLRNRSKLSRISFIVLFSRFIGIFAILLIALFSLFFFMDQVSGKDILINKNYVYQGLLLAVLLTVLIFFIKPFTWIYHRTGRKIKLLKYLSSFESIYGRDTMAWAILYSFLIQLFTIFGTYLYYYSIGIHLDILKCLIYIPVALFLAFLIPSINGMGVREYFLYTFFSTETVSVENLFLVSLQIFLCILTLTIAGWIVYLLKKRKR